MAPRSEVSGSGMDYLSQDELPEYLKRLREGISTYGDSKVPIDSTPNWFNADKFYTGQRIAMKHFFGLTASLVLSVLFIYCIPEGLRPVIFTRQSDTPYKAFKRYLSTILRIKSWYTNDVLDPKTEGYKELKHTRVMHEQVRSKMMSSDPEDIEKKATLKSTWSPLYEVFREDFRAACPVPKALVYDADAVKNIAYINQTEMALLQFGFAGVFIRYASWFGAGSMSESEKQSFLHMWAVLGYLLGIDDKHNFCLCDVKTVNQRTDDVINFIVKPSLCNVTPEWEHIVRSLVEGISYYIPLISFDSLFLFTCDVLGLDTPRFRSVLTLKEKILYKALYVVKWLISNIPGARQFFNRMLDTRLQDAQTGSPDWHKKLQKKKYPFEEN